MEENFEKIVQEKTKDELINILLNKTEYKEGLVVAAETELRLRQSQDSNKNVKTVSPPYIPQEIEFQSQIYELNKLIDKQKEKAMSFGTNPEIVSLLYDTIKSPESARIFINNYRTLCNSNIIESLKNLSSSFDTIKSYLKIFIDFNIVQGIYPHEFVLSYDRPQPSQFQRPKTNSTPWIVVVIIGIVISLFALFKSGIFNNSGNSDFDAPIFHHSEKDVTILQKTCTYEPYTNSYTIHCRIRNNTKNLIEFLDLTATFYSKSGKIVGTGYGNTANLAGGAEKTVDVLGFDIDNVSTWRVEIDKVMY